MMRFLPVTLDTLLVELDDLQQTLALLAALQAQPVEGVEDLVPAARTIMVRFRPALITQDELIQRISRYNLAAPIERASTRVEIPVDYEGEDLNEIAQLLGISREEVIERHTGSEYTVAFTGFAPGFAYLSGGHPSLNVPRRQSPRTHVPAGAVGLAGQFSGVYPQAGPGGWQIIGLTAAPMWDLERKVPALLQPGFKVRFVQAQRPRGNTPSKPLAPSVPASALVPDGTAPHNGAVLEICSTGLLALLQDLGRPGLSGQGVGASGAMDPDALRTANRLVGNASDRACIEIVYGGFCIQSHGDAVVAFAGADAPLELQCANGLRHSMAGHQPIALSDGDRLTLGKPQAGIRSYLAVRGGFAVAPVLGSHSTDTLAKVGPPPLKTGDRLPVQAVRGGAIVGPPEAPRADLPRAQQPVVLDVVLGPRTDWFTPAAVELLASQLWTLTPQSNRIGLRLEGAQTLAREHSAELPSEGAVLGAIQVPPSGQPVLFLADHPLTGGYPVIGAVAPHHLGRAGQIPIGAQVRFNPIRAFSVRTATDSRDSP